jgi:hypothetical protein
MVSNLGQFMLRAQLILNSWKEVINNHKHKIKQKSPCANRNSHRGLLSLIQLIMLGQEFYFSFFEELYL